MGFHGIPTERLLTPEQIQEQENHLPEEFPNTDSAVGPEDQVVDPRGPGWDAEVVSTEGEGGAGESGGGGGRVDGNEGADTELLDA